MSRTSATMRIAERTTTPIGLDNGRPWPEVVDDVDVAGARPHPRQVPSRFEFTDANRLLRHLHR